MPTTWQKIKEFPGFIASVIAVIAAGGSLATWVTGYFAAKSYVDEVRCVSDASEDNLSAQIEASALYEKYQRHKVRVSELEKAVDDNPNIAIIKATLDEEIKQRESAWEGMRGKFLEADEADKRRKKCGLTE